jgi:hypothetical protein
MAYPKGQRSPIRPGPFRFELNCSAHRGCVLAEKRAFFPITVMKRD